MTPLDQRQTDTRLEEELTEIIRAATCGALTDDDARVLCFGCGLDHHVVLPKRNEVPARFPPCRPNSTPKG